MAYFCMTITLFLLVTQCFTSTLASADLDIADYTDHPCVRHCVDGAPARTCKYHWILETYNVLSSACGNCPLNQSDCSKIHCVPANGVARTVKTANRKLPGPAIHVCLGDQVEVTVDNRMENEEGTSIHWHGVFQTKTPHMDGVAMVTQCPIPAHTQFTYSFAADNAGTHFWHAHSGFQKADGLFGALVIHNPPALDPSYQSYDHDLPEHVMVLTDWVKELTGEYYSKLFHAKGTFRPTYILVNGLGPDKAEGPTETPRPIFKVKAGSKYRFRIISSGSFACAIQMSIDNHTMSVIASDGHSVEPMPVDSFSIYAGERFDFVLNANRSDPLKKYWIRFRGIEGCQFAEIFQTAILEYEGSTDLLPEGNTTYLDTYRDGIELNPLNTKASAERIPVTEMQSTSPDDDTLTSDPDRKIYLALDWIMADNPKRAYQEHYPAKTDTPQINGISMHLPPSPPLSQMRDIPESMYCNQDTVQQSCAREYCECVHRYQIGLGELVELIMVDVGTKFLSNHPMHIHGYSFRVIGMKKFNTSTTMDEVKRMDANGELQRLTSKAPLKDTVSVPSRGYTIVRFRADNPGIWLFHCHINEHAELGMSLIFQVGNATQMPRVPKGFPRCGSWRFHGYEKDEVEEKDDNDDGDNDKDINVKCSVTLNTNTNSGFWLPVSVYCLTFGLIVATTSTATNYMY